MARRFAKVSEEEIKTAFFYPSDLVNTKTTTPLRVGEERWIYSSTLRVSVYIHHYSPPLPGIVVYYSSFSKMSRMSLKSWVLERKKVGVPTTYGQDCRFKRYRKKLKNLTAGHVVHTRTELCNVFSVQEEALSSGQSVGFVCGCLGFIFRSNL